MGYTYNSITCIKQEEEDKRVNNKKEIIIKIKDFSRTGNPFKSKQCNNCTKITIF